MSDVVDNLNKLCDEHQKQLSIIRSKIRDIETIPKAKALVGKCFKYLDVSGMFNNRKIWIYKYVVSSKDDYVLIDSFHTDPKMYRIELSYSISEPATYFNHQGLIEITPKQYTKAYNNLVKRIVELGKKRGYNGK